MLAIIARTGESCPALVDVPEPEPPGEDEVLCRTLEVGICGTDREILESTKPRVPAGSQFLILGHESLARVEQVGPGVDSFCPGDLVSPMVRRPPTPHVRADMLAFGNFTERGIVEEHGFTPPFWLDRPEHLCKVDPRLRSVAILAEPVSVVEKAINEAVIIQTARLAEFCDDWTPRVLVTGMGPIAFAAILACRCRGWVVTVHGRDPRDSKRATTVGLWNADYVPMTEDVTDQFDVERDGFDLVLECTGNDRVMLSSARHLASCGVMAWLGSSRLPRSGEHDVSTLMRDAVLRNHVHLGSVNAARRDIIDALAHLGDAIERWPQAADAMITTRLDPKESLWHYQHREPQGIKAILDYGCE